MSQRLRNIRLIAWTLILEAWRRREIYASDPEFGEPGQPLDQLPEEVRVRLQQATAAMRVEITPFSNAEVVKDLAKVVAKAS